MKNESQRRVKISSLKIKYKLSLLLRPNALNSLLKLLYRCHDQMLKNLIHNLNKSNDFAKYVFLLMNIVELESTHFSKFSCNFQNMRLCQVFCVISYG